jgi:hypothetical protein
MTAQEKSQVESGKAFFYRSQLLFTAGDTIQPGSWGKAILGIGPRHNRYYPEYVLERIRAAEFQALPSRLSVCFVFEDFDACKNWSRTVVQGVSEHIYQVVVTDAEAVQFRGNLGWIDAMPDYRTFDGLDDCVRRYWRGEDRNANQWERLIASPIRVLTCLSKVE